jgi:hypothetical protein
MSARKNYHCRTYPPAGTHRSIAERTIGVVDDLTSIKKDFTLEHCLPSDERADLGYSGRS